MRCLKKLLTYYNNINIDNNSLKKYNKVNTNLFLFK